MLFMVFFMGFDIYTRQVLCVQTSSYFQNSVLGPTESSDCLNHLSLPSYSAKTSARLWHFGRKTFISGLFFSQLIH